MKRSYLLLPLLGLLIGCASSRIDNSNVKLTYLDEYVLDANTQLGGNKVGGLSGIDYKDGEYYLICDQASKPRFYKAEIALTKLSIDSVMIKEQVMLDRSSDFLKKHTMDMESIRFDEANNQVLITSEGAINDGQDPSVVRLTPEGKFISAFKLPEQFTASGEQKPRNNGVFEGLAEGINKEGYWVATELPLEKDGPAPKFYPTKSLSRITYYNARSQEAKKQFTYKLGRESKLPINFFAVNGITELLEYKKDHFLVLERGYAAGYGSHGNTIKVFDVDASKATNTLEMESLKGKKIQPATKKLVFNFKSVRKQLTDKIIDNIEGMCFGPVLPDGKQSLIFISDNNFSSYGKQLNQFILFEIDLNN